MAEKTTESLKLPKLKDDRSNFVIWRLHMIEKLAAEGIEPSIHQPPDLLLGLHDPNIRTARNMTMMQLARAISLVRLSLSNELVTQTVNHLTPYDLWRPLEERFLSMRDVFLPEARADWHNLRVCDFTSIHSYTCQLYRITATLDFCGQPMTEQDMIEKTISSIGDERAVLREQQQTFLDELHLSLDFIRNEQPYSYVCVFISQDGYEEALHTLS